MADVDTSGGSEPLDLIGLSLNENVFVKLRGGRELYGLLHVSSNVEDGGMEGRRTGTYLLMNQICARQI